MNACFLVPIFASGENLSFFLAAFVGDDFEPIVGGVYNIFDAFLDDGGIVADIADDINDVGVMFDGRFNVDPFDDGNVDGKVNTAGFPQRLIDLPASFPDWLFRFGGMLRLTAFAVAT